MEGLLFVLILMWLLVVLVGVLLGRRYLWNVWKCCEVVDVVVRLVVGGG